MYEQIKQEMLKCAEEMLHYRLISLSGGNIGVKAEKDRFLITPSAMDYKGMVPSDIVVVNSLGEVIEGSRRPSSDLAALLYLFERKHDVAAVIHTHQPYATSAGLVSDVLPACLVTLIDTNHTDVPVAPFTVSSDKGMGEQFIKYCGIGNSVILKNHGVLTVGKTLCEALENAVYLEESALAYMTARSVGQPALLSPEEIAAEDAPRGYYGQ